MWVQVPQVVQDAWGEGSNEHRPFSIPQRHPLFPSPPARPLTAKSLPASPLTGCLLRAPAHSIQPHSPLCAENRSIRRPGPLLSPPLGRLRRLQPLPRVARKRPPTHKPGHRGESGGSPATPPRTPRRRGPGRRLSGGRCGPSCCQLGGRRERGGGISIIVSETRRQRQREVERERDREKEKE